MKKLYVVKKYVWALTAKDAIRMESDVPVDDVWIDDDWKKTHYSVPVQKK